MRRMLRFVCPMGSLAFTLLLVAPALAAEEPQSEEALTVTIQKAAGEAAEAAQEAAEKIAAEAQRRATEAAAEIAEQAQSAAEDVANEAAEAAHRAVKLAGERSGIISLKIDYQLDMSVAPVPPALDAQLKLDGKGVLVERVDNDGPAAKAGIKRYDLIIAVNDEPIGGIKELMKTVHESGGKPLHVKVLRSGESQVITVTPKQDSSVSADIRVPTEEVEVEIRGLESKIRQKLKDAGVDMRLQLLRPGHILPPGTKFKIASPIPDDLTFKIEKEGSKPAQITIKKGDESWTTTEDKLDALPDELRPHAERLLGRIPTPFAISAPDGKRHAVPFPPGIPPRPVVIEEVREKVRKEVARAREVEEDVRKEVHHGLEHRLEAMSREMARMSKQLESLRRQMHSDAEDKQPKQEDEVHPE